jgi:hydroxyacylglutathione hydrolase
VIFARRRCLRDNYVYLLAEGADSALVDPGDAAAALALAAEHGARPRFLLHTHGHADHTGGTAEVRTRLGARAYGHAGDAAWFPPEVDVSAGGALRLGSMDVRVHLAPGHTPGSVLYEWRGRLLTGDTLFRGGSGNCKHGGDPARLAETFLGVLAVLDGGLEVHPGHDYAEANLPFDLDLEPGNTAAADALAQAREAHARGDEPRAFTLAEERALSPFLRAGSVDVRRALQARGIAARDARQAFLALRRLKDAWPGPGATP